MNDTISRQEAIKTIMREPGWHSSDGSYYHSSVIKHVLKSLPSVQPEITLELAIDYLYKIGWMQEHDRILTESARPEIIRCKDCEYFLPPHGCGHIDGMVTADENRFCSYAKQKGENDGEMRS